MARSSRPDPAKARTAAPSSAWVQPPLPPILAATAPTTFVGRREAIDTLESVWELAMAGQGQAVFIGGEPGVGKSRLATEAVRAFHAAGATALVGSCWPDLGQPYQPFDEPVSALLDLVGASRLLLGDAASGDQQQALQHLAAVAGRTAHHETSAGPAYARAVLDAVVSLLRAATASRPLVLLLDDVHWAGPSGLALLSHVVERACTVAPVILLATYRSTQPDRSDELAATMARLHRLDAVRRLDLGGLTVWDVAEFLIRDGGLAVGGAREVAAAVRDQCGGNPYILRELWRELPTGGWERLLQDNADGPPTSIKDMLETRLTALDPEVRRSLDIAALIGGNVDPALVVAARGGEPGESLRSLDVAVEAGLLEPQPGAGGLLRFVHGRVRQVVLDAMPPGRHAETHLAIAQALAAGFPAVANRSQRLARHFVGAAPLGYAAEAVTHVERAAEQAKESLAHAEAGSLYEQAAALSHDEVRCVEFLTAAAACHVDTPDFDRARRTASRAAELSSGPRLLDAAVLYEAASWRPGHDGDRSVALLSRALEAPELDETRRIRGMASLGRALAFSGASANGRVLGDEAVSEARRLGDRGLLGDALAARVMHSLTMADHVGLAALCEELMALGAETGDANHVAQGASMRGMVAYPMADRDTMLRARAAMAQATRRTGSPWWEYFTASLTFGDQYLQGDLAAAEATAGWMADIVGRFGSDETQGPYGAQMFMIRRESGRLESVRPLVTGSENCADHWAPGLLALYTELGLADASRLLMWTLLRSPADTASADWPARLVFTTEAALRLDDHHALRMVRPLLLEQAGENLAMGSFVAMFGSSDCYLGQIDSVLGAGDPDAWFASALDLDRRTGSVLHEAQTLAARAAHLRRHGVQRERVAELQDQAVALARPRGLVRIVRAARSTRTSEPFDSVLTTREIDVVRLVVEGRSNRAIAEALVISEHTAANHLRNILAKTGAANRTQAARYAREHGLV